MNDFYFYCETAFHHQGDPDYLKKLVDAAKEAGADGVKFQVLTSVSDFVSTANKAYATLAGYVFDLGQWRDIFAYSQSAGLDIILMPLNVESLELTREFPIRYIEIHSVSFNDKALHAAIKATGCDLIIGVGGRTMEEIAAMKTEFGTQLKVLMAGFQAFPSDLADIKLGKISYLAQRYPELEIGYADHSAFDNEFAVLANDYAYLLGARIFEKHIAIEEGVERVDYSAAVSKKKIAESIRRLTFLRDHAMLRENDYLSFNAPEQRYRDRQLVCVATRDLKTGETVSASDIALKLADSESEPVTIIASAVGKTLRKDIPADAPLLKENLK
jgi:sialic acid synthase SpsE